MTEEELAVIRVSQGLNENTAHLFQMHKQRKLTTKVTNRLYKPKNLLNSMMNHSKTGTLFISLLSHLNEINSNPICYLR